MMRMIVPSSVQMMQIERALLPYARVFIAPRRRLAFCSGVFAFRLHIGVDCESESNFSICDHGGVPVRAICQQNDAKKKGAKEGIKRVG